MASAQQKSIIRFWHLPVCLALVVFVNSYAQIPYPKNWPLKNGDFRHLRRPSLNIPTGWNRTTQSGSYLYGREPGDMGIQNREQVVTITSVSSGVGVWWQAVDFLPGDYTLTAGVYLTAGATARIAAPGGIGLTITGTGDWGEYSYDFTATGPGVVHLYLIGNGTAKFRRVNVAIRSLNSSSVKFEDNSNLGAIELPASPDPAEEYAAYELQRYIYQMTGKTPGLLGRDTTYPGRKIKVGSAAPSTIRDQLTALSPDSFYIGLFSDDIILVGNTPTGTLYAVYDFLNLQGCYWLAPTPAGKVIPQRSTLSLPAEQKIEEPDYLARGFNVDAQRYYLTGGWIFVDIEDYLDWAVWNRLNNLAFEYGKTVDFGAHRGYGHQQTIGHSWSKFLLDDHPEWWPLVNGVRTKYHTSGRPNQLSVSSQTLRDYVVSTIIDYFNQNPRSTIYALNAEDEPNYWCESAGDRALDSDYGTGPWIIRSDGLPTLSMTDRSVHFVNEIASRVAQVHPGKRIEMYSYGSTTRPPVRWQVNPNVMIKITYWPGAPVNKPILDASDPYNAAHIARMQGWLNAGAVNMGLYDYGLIGYPDVANFYFYHQADYLRTFHKEWGVRICQTEQDTAILPSLMWYLLRARSYWNVDIDYQQEIAKICNVFYGPAATKMTNYYLYMDQAVRQTNIWSEFPKVNVPKIMTQGRQLLDQAISDAGTDSTLLNRIAYAEFGHAVATISVCKMSGPTLDAKKEISKAYFRARELYERYPENIMLSPNTISFLNKLWFIPFGYKWNRLNDWTPEMNPDDGWWGELAWEYKYSARGGGFGSNNPWFDNPSYRMIWKDPGWKMSLFSSSPIIYKDYVLTTIGAGYNPIIEWQNTTKEAQNVKITGQLTFRWLAFCDVTDVEMKIIKIKPSSNQKTDIYSTTILKPTRAKISINEQQILNLEIPDFVVDENDKVYIGYQLTAASGSGAVHIFDDKLNIEVFAHIPQFCGDVNTEYPEGDISGANGQKDCAVNLYDLAALASDWLACTDPQQNCP